MSQSQPRRPQHSATLKPAKLCERCGKRPPEFLNIWCKPCNTWLRNISVAIGCFLLGALITLWYW